MASSPFFALFIALLISCILLPQKAAASPLSYLSHKPVTLEPELERVETFSTTTSSMPLQPQHTLPPPAPIEIPTTLSTSTVSRRPMIIIPPKRSATVSPTAESLIWFKRDTGTPFDPPLPTASRACHVDPHQPHCVSYLKTVTDYQSLYTPPASAPTPFPCNVRDSLAPRCREYLHSLEAAAAASSVSAAFARAIEIPVAHQARSKKGWGWKRHLADQVTTNHFAESEGGEEMVGGAEAVSDVNNGEAKKGDWKKPPE